MSIIFVAVLIDLAAISVVVSIYFHRHQRRDLLLSYVALNSGVLAVTVMLSSAPVSAGLGLGLFGILSIIRLRSDSITQEEIAYYFIALALGLITGLHPLSMPAVAGLAALLVAVMYVADHPRLFSRARHLLLTIDAAIPDETALRREIEDRLGVEVRRLIVQEIDFVRDVTIVDVRSRHAKPEARSRSAILLPVRRAARVGGDLVDVDAALATTSSGLHVSREHV
jgi:hypothetical protein